MIFSPEETYEILEPCTYPVTTGHLLQELRILNNLSQYGGDTRDVKPALDTLSFQGLVVSARKVRRSNNPYQFVARPEDLRPTYWMAKHRADAFGEELARQQQQLLSAQRQATRLKELLPGLYIKVAVAVRTGALSMMIEGTGAHLSTVLEALERTSHE